MLCSTIWNAMPSAVMPNAAAAMGKRIWVAASAPVSRPCQVSKSHRAQSRNEAGLSLPLAASSLVAFCARPTRDKMRRHGNEDKTAHDEEQVVRHADAGEAPYPHDKPCHEP